MARRYDKWLAEKKYKAKMNLLSKIRREVNPIIQAYDEALESCDGRTRGIIFQGYKNESVCSKLSVHGFGYLMPNMEQNNSIGYKLLGA